MIEANSGTIDSKIAAVAAAKSKLDLELGNFDKGTNEALFKYFETESNPSLVAGVGGMVALLRNNKTATNVDVELYLADYSKLMYKLKRADYRTIKLDIAVHH